MINKYRVYSLIIVLFIAFLGWFYIVQPEVSIRTETNQKTKDKIAFGQENNAKGISLGLDLVGGSQLNYEADVSKLPSHEIDDAMESLKETLTRKLNASGTSEVSIVVERPSIFSENDNESTRIVNISIPGVSDIEEAKKMVGDTPTLDFKIRTENGYEDTGLTGKQLKDANLTRDQLGQPAVLIRFDEEGTELFAKLTDEYIGEQMGIFIDNVPISEPILRAKISDGVSVIEGNFTLEEASTLTRNLKFGALPVPITLVSSNSVSPTLGDEVLKAGVLAALIGLALVSIFLILFYRLAGFVATLALISYVILTLSLFKFLGFVFTAAGIAGFIISIGMAVDANILIFERIKEELRAGRAMRESIENGFKRAWLSIRDGNLSSIITAVILFYMTTALVKGFSLTFGFGVLVSMLTAIILTRTFLLAMVENSNKNKLKKAFFGVNNKKK